MPKQNHLLEFKLFGQGDPIILLHGLFGSKENLGMIARPLAEHFQVIAIDLRNHGRSFHEPAMDYPAMAQDVLQLMDHLQLEQCMILGHSMGGKVAMQLALTYQNRVAKLIVADIAPVSYKTHHQQIMAGLQLLNQSKLETRKQADELLTPFEEDIGTRQFLLTNLQRNAHKQLQLRLNVEAIANNQQAICAAVTGEPFDKPVFFIRGGNSNYIAERSLPTIEQLFPSYQLATIEGAGHMLHAEQPDKFNALLGQFLQP